MEPIRKRGYHRALKRGAPWAVMRKLMIEMTNKLWSEMFWGQSKWDKAWSDNAKLSGLGESIKITTHK